MEFSVRRKALMDQTKRKAICIIPGASEKIRNGDCHYAFRQQSDFYYLTGFNEPDAIALLAPNHLEGDFILFNQPRDPAMEIWNGYRAGQDGACNDYHANSAYDIKEFWERLPTFFSDYDTIVMPLGQNAQFEQKLFATLDALKKDKRSAVKVPSQIVDLTKFTHEMRLFKSTEELKNMQQAVAISVDAHLMCMQQARAEMFEYELEAMIMQAIYRHGSRAAAYSSIVGSGKNACTLHYIANNQKLHSGDLVLIDAGAEVNCYAADITRTFPVDKQFSAEQKAIYEIVLTAQQAAIDSLKPGLAWENIQKTVVEQLTTGLCELGILQGSVDDNIENKTYRQFYMHGAGHWLGIDVHDAGDYKIAGKSRPLSPGMVFTIEPGIYISPSDAVDERWWNIGIRIEDDILLTEKGCNVLSSALPKTIADVEAIRRS